MPVGAGSIKRAAKLNAGAENKAADKAKAVVNAEVKEQVVDTVNADKKTKTAKKAATTKKATVKKSTVSSTKEPVVQQLGSNQVCHLTEELPIYLL